MSRNKKSKKLLVKEDNAYLNRSLQKLCWETSADALSPFGDVLEIGFEDPVFSNYIQTYFPKSHMIIESRPMLQRKARQWSLDYLDVAVKKKMPMKLGHEKFDAIFLNNLADILFVESLGDYGKTQTRSPLDALALATYTLRQCLYHHMREGAGFSFFVSAKTDLWQDPLFSEVLLDSPAIDYSERVLSAEDLAETENEFLEVKLIRVIRQL